MLMPSSQNEEIRVTYHTPPTKGLLESQTMVLIAMMRVNPRMGATMDTVTGTIIKTVE
jgi:hypothetical protein